MNSKWFCDIDSEFATKKVNLLRISYFFTNVPQSHPFFANSHSIHFQFSRIHIEFTICFPNSLTIYYLYREFTANWFPSSRIHNGFTIFRRYSKRIHYFFRQFSLNSLSSLELKSYSLSLTEILNEFSSFFAEWIHYPFHGFTTNTLFSSRIYSEFTTFFANLLWIPIFSQIHSKFTS